MMSAWYLPDSISASETPTLAISGRGEDVGRHLVQLERHDAVAQEVRDRDPALHGGDGGQRQHAGAVAGGVDVRRGGAGDAVDLDVAALGERDAGLLEADAGGVRDGADADQAVAAGDLGAVAEGDHHAVARCAPRSRRGRGTAPCTPRRSKTPSSTSAASVSEPGSTRSRLEIRVTLEPRPL